MSLCSMDESMSAPPSGLSRLYLVPAALVVLLGGLSLWHHLHQPKYPPGPGRGCVTAKFPSPDTLHIPADYLELQSCPHISETIFTASSYRYTPAEDVTGSRIFTAIGPENPWAWAQSLRLRWRSMDSVEVGYTSAVRFEEQLDRAHSIRFSYILERGEQP